MHSIKLLKFLTLIVFNRQPFNVKAGFILEPFHKTIWLKKKQSHNALHVTVTPNPIIGESILAYHAEARSAVIIY